MPEGSGAPGQVDLPDAIDHEPAAVLMVDLRTRRVVHVNDVATELAPSTALPLDLDAWSDAAQLRDIDGEELSDTEHPLSRVARSEPVAGQAVSAARRSAMGGQREPLWVVALPMRGAPMLDDHALVVLIPMSRAQGRESEDAGGLGSLPPGLQHRAVNATAMSFTVADALHPEQPLVWVNPAFTVATGYELDDVVGRNCRFLQGPETDPAGPAQMRDAIDRGVSTTVTLLNYRKDGTPFWNQVDLSPVRDAHGQVAHYVGIQSDVTLRVEADLRTRRALRAEQEARADADAARARLAFLGDAVNRLTSTLDEADCADLLLQLVVPSLADWALLLRAGEATNSSMRAARHRDPARQGEVDAYLAAMPDWLRSGHLTDLLLDGHAVRVIDGLAEPASAEERSQYMRDPAMAEATAALDGQVAVVAALPGRTGVRDLLVLVRTSERASFPSDDLVLIGDLARRAGLVMENAHLFTVQAEIAQTLQRSLLPELPEVAGIRSASRYAASQDGASIGGDFFELIDLGGGSFALVVGDVTGHDISSAAAMGHLKGLLRATILGGHTSPSAVFERVDHLMAVLRIPTIASALLAHVSPSDDGWEVTWSSAGHLPLLVARPGDRPCLLDPTSRLNDLLLGVNDETFGSRRTDHRIVVPAGSTLLGYTDGLIERRGETIETGLDRLLAAADSQHCDPEQLCERLMDTLGREPDDDVALIAVRLS